MTTDEPDEQLDPASPEDEARIRQLLSGARETGPIPASVAARLDDTLIGLAAERTTIDPIPADNVIPITRTRRHRVVAVLGAAAAVAVFGLVSAPSWTETRDAWTTPARADTAVERGGNEGFDEGAAPTEDEIESRTGAADNPEAGPTARETGPSSYAPGNLTRDLPASRTACSPYPTTPTT